MYAGVAATVNVNLIEGATDAKISNAILNGAALPEMAAGQMSVFVPVITLTVPAL